MKAAERTQKYDLSGSPSTIHIKKWPWLHKQSLESLSQKNSMNAKIKD